MKEIKISASSKDEALDKAVSRFRLPKQAFLDVEETSEGENGTSSEDESLYLLEIEEKALADKTRDQIIGLLNYMDIEAEVRVKPGSDFINVDIVSEKGSILIGRRGQTLDAIQHIINRMVSRNEKDMPLVIVDVEKYRVRSHNRIKRMASNAAKKAANSRKPVKLNPMPSTERKFVHKFLSDFEGVRTHSVGKEGQRRVVVTPDSAPRPKQGDEDLLPEIKNNLSGFKKARSLFNDEAHKKRNNTRKPDDSDDMGELLDPKLFN